MAEAPNDNREADPSPSTSKLMKQLAEFFVENGIPHGAAASMSTPITRDAELVVDVFAGVLDSHRVCWKI